MLKNKKNGFSLVEALVAAAIIGVSMALIAQVFSDVFRAESRIQFMQSSFFLGSSMAELLSDQETCERNFGATAAPAFNINTSAPQPLRLLNKDGTENIFVINNRYEKETVILNSFTIENYQSRGGLSNSGTLDLTVELVHQITNRVLEKVIKLSVVTNGAGMVVNCRAINRSINQPWIMNSGGHVIFQGHNVGIGDFVNPMVPGGPPQPPVEKLEVRDNTNRAVVLASAFYKLSDRRTKNILGPAQGLDLVRDLRGYRYVTRESDRPAIGFVAQEMEKVMPEAVRTHEISGLKSVSYSQVIAPLVEASKELDKNIWSLENDLIDMEDQMTAIEEKLGEVEIL